MAPESSKQKPNERKSFDDDLGDDFLSSWKPSCKPLAGLDFEDDEPAPKNRKASFSLAKMDTSFDFDFDGGLNALSKFNVDMSDLDFPSSRDKTFQKKDSSQEKRSTKEGESKFSFQFNGFDELDLDDTLRTNKEPETPVHSKKVKEDVSPPSTASGYCRTNKEPEPPVYAKKGTEDFSPPSTASGYCKQELRESNSDDASESTLMPMAGTSVNKESHKPWSSDDASESTLVPMAGTSINNKPWKREPAPDQGVPSGGLTFSDDEDSVHELGLPLQDKQEQSCSKADNYTPQKRTDSDLEASTTISKEATKVVSPTRAHVNVSEEPDDRNESEEAAPSEFGVESSKKAPSNIEMEVSSSEIEAQELPVENNGLGMMQLSCKEELKARMEMDETPQSKESSKAPCTDNLGILEEPSKKEEREQQKSLVYKLEPRQGNPNDERCLIEKGKVPTMNLREGIVLDSTKVPVGLSDTRPMKGQGADLDSVGRVNASFAPKQSNQPQAVPTGISPQAPPGRPAKRKFSGEQRTSDSPSSKGNSSKKLELDDISKKTEEQQASDSATSRSKCKDLQNSPAENHHDTSPFFRKTAPKVVAERSSQGATFLSKTTIRSSLQAPRSLLGTRGNDSKFQEQAVSLAKVKTPITSLRNNAAERKPTMLGGLHSPSLPSTVQQKRSLYQLNSTKDLPNTNFGRNRHVAGKQLEGLTLHKTSSLAVLSKTKVTGALRETCAKAYNFDVATSKGTIASHITHSSTRIDKLKSAETPDEELPVLTPGKPDTEMADIQNVKALRESIDKDTVETKDDESLLVVSIENDDGIREKSENYANRLDQLLKELKDKYEEAMDLRVQAIVVNNNFLMLNNPVDDEKISFPCICVNFIYPTGNNKLRRQISLTNMHIRKITHYVREKLSLETQCQAVMQQS